jgi:hypothetical protein
MIDLVNGCRQMGRTVHLSICKGGQYVVSYKLVSYLRYGSYVVQCDKDIQKNKNSLIQSCTESMIF